MLRGAPHAFDSKKNDKRMQYAAPARWTIGMGRFAFAPLRYVCGAPFAMDSFSPKAAAFRATKSQACISTKPWKDNYLSSVMRGNKFSCHSEEHMDSMTAHSCTVYAIRHHLKVAKSAEVARLCNNVHFTSGLFTRARNARLIMSNVIPDMQTADSKPYCIWYPDVADESTYRELARRYPDMRYHIGRACAVAGYSALYHELKLLPDVSIAEEARDNRGEADAIFQSIASHSTRYIVMDDYTRTVNLENPECTPYLNGDTAVISTLSYAWGYKTVKTMNTTYEHYFDIQEDECVGIKDCPGTVYRQIPTEFVHLLYSPLPTDLPNINKDALILMAAWEGNIDRYWRLRRRSKRISGEISAVIRGAYHHTAFARWLDNRLEQDFDEGHDVLRQAVLARFIMNNDLSRIDHETDGDELPVIFWWPHVPHENTLRELAWRRPDMKEQVSVACIYANYQGLYDELWCRPNASQWEMACQSANPYYRKTIEQRAVDEYINLGIHKPKFHHGVPVQWSKEWLTPDLEPTGLPKLEAGIEIAHEDRPFDPCSWKEEWYYEGDLLDEHMQCQIARWNTFISATDEARRKPGNLYDTLEDRQRRSTPALKPLRPKDS